MATKSITTTFLTCLIFAYSVHCAHGASINKGIEYYDDRNYSAAVEELEPLADQGDSMAQLLLANIYYYGKDVEKNTIKAFLLCKKAAEQGEVKAQVFLGSMYIQNPDVIHDAEQSLYWFRKAAEQGSFPAKMNMGLMYEKGYDGFPKDNVKALAWYSVAASGDNRIAIMYREKIIERMTPEQISEAQELSDQLYKNIHNSIK